MSICLSAGISESFSMFILPPLKFYPNNYVIDHFNFFCTDTLLMITAVYMLQNIHD